MCHTIKHKMQKPSKVRTASSTKGKSQQLWRWLSYRQLRWAFALRSFSGSHQLPLKLCVHSTPLRFFTLFSRFEEFLSSHQCVHHQCHCWPVRWAEIPRPCEWTWKCSHGVPFLWRNPDWTGTLKTERRWFGAGEFNIYLTEAQINMHIEAHTVPDHSNTLHMSVALHRTKDTFFGQIHNETSCLSFASWDSSTWSFPDAGPLRSLFLSSSIIQGCLWRIGTRKIKQIQEEVLTKGELFETFSFGISVLEKAKMQNQRHNSHLMLNPT